MMKRDINRTEATRLVETLIRNLGVDPATDTTQLSGGEQQRVSIARASAANPRLCADEPTAALDEQTAHQVMDSLVGQCRETGSALFMVTHDSRVAARADTHWELANQRIHRI